MKNKTFVLIAVAVAALAFLGLKFLAQPKPVDEAPKTNVYQESFVRPHSPILGNSLGRVTVIEWFDPECESCRAIHPAFKKVVADYKDRVRFVLRYMPYHQGSMYAASALEEAREFGKYEEALDLLFEKQPEWGDHHNPRPDLIPTYLMTLGIPKEKLQPDYLIKKHGDKIRQDEQDGKTVGIRGTPSFYVNGQSVQQLGEQPLRNAIEQALEGSK